MFDCDMIIVVIVNQVSEKYLGLKPATYLSQFKSETV